jgi:uncharacterized membrane protein
MNLKRLVRHLMTPHWVARRAFPRRTLDVIEAAIRASEQAHDSELRFVIEAALHPLAVARGVTPRARAVELFSALRVWDTEHNSGVLIYVQLVDRHIEVVADRGISARVSKAEWNGICRRIEQAYRRGEFEQGSLAGISEMTRMLAAHFPPRGPAGNELPDRPLVL